MISAAYAFDGLCCIAAGFVTSLCAQGCLCPLRVSVGLLEGNGRASWLVGVRGFVIALLGSNMDGVPAVSDWFQWVWYGAG